MINTSDAIFGGGICCSAASPEIINCTFNGNDGDYGGGICCFAFSAPHVLNCIVQGTVAGAGIFSSSSPGITINYCDFHNNQGANFTGTLPPGIGILNGVNANGDSCDAYHNLYLNPLLVNPPGGNFQLQVNSPCIDAGDPASPLDPDGTIADIGAFYYDQSVQITIALTPVNPPIIIPATGGNFDWNVLITNNEAGSQSFNFWTVITLPSGNTRLGAGPYNLTLGAGATLNRTRTQNISFRYPPGNYSYTGNVGTYPGTVWDSDTFPFTKAAAGEGCWAGSPCSATLTPGEYLLHGASPNPFNPSTNIRFDLPEASEVLLTIYGVNGRQVATLVHGWRDAGVHQVTFDGSDLAAGIYIVHIMAGEFSAVQKLVLMK